MIARALILWLAVVATGVSVGAFAQGKSHGNNLYRYENSAGVTVIDFSLPAEYADDGYEILSPSGRVIERVPAKTDDEVSPEQAADRTRDDQFILSSYSTVADVERAKRRRLSQLEREIETLEANIADYQERRAQYQQKAAGYQRSGRQPPAVIDRVLVDLNVQERKAMEVLAERRDEYREIAARYDRYARRLVELKGQEAGAGGTGTGSPPADNASGKAPGSAPATGPARPSSAAD
jgi:hypothetical protein